MTDAQKPDAADATFEARRRHLADMSDEALYAYFWELANKIVDPLIEAGRIYTTPAIERSVLLRMGFSSLEAKAIVAGMMEHHLMPHGAGHVVWKLATERGEDIRATGVRLADGELWDDAVRLFEEVDR